MEILTPAATLEGAAEHAALLELEVQRLREQVARLQAERATLRWAIEHDELTGLANRRLFNAVAPSLLRQYQRCAVLVLDLNEFKPINDRYGHAAGDAALVAVAERLTAEVRAAGAVGRIGGDEFAVLLQHADLKAASVKAVSLAMAVSGARIAFGGNEIAVSMTYGVRQIGAVDSAEEALSEADAAMYLRKPTRG